MTSVIAAGDGSMSGGKYRGIASDAHLVLIKIATPEGFIKERDILRGLQWLIDNHHIYNIRVVNISVGGDHVDYSPDHPIHLAIETLTKEGITVLAAAGNRGEGYLLPPASAPCAITVGGYDDHNTLDRSLWTGYANNYGTVYGERRKPEIAGPAAWLAAPILPDSQIEREARWLAPLMHKNSSDRALKLILAAGYQDLKLTPLKGKVRVTDELYAELQSRIHKHKLIDEHHQHVDGTSVSVAIVASVVAQMLEANPYLTPLQIRNTLMATATPLPAVASERQGAGVIDAVRAVELMRLDT
jgi:serine protease AprX